MVKVLTRSQVGAKQMNYHQLPFLVSKHLITATLNQQAAGSLNINGLAVL